MKTIITISLCFFSLFAISQQKNSISKREQKTSQKYTHSANEKSKYQEFEESEYDYKKAIHHNEDNITAKYNLGTTYFKNKKYDESYYTLMEASKVAETKKEKHKIYHNMGNAFMAKRDYKNAMKAYQQSLMYNPKDDKTRYNFVLAKELLKNNPPKKDKDKKDKDKKDKDKKDKDKKDKDKKDKDKKDKDKKDKDKKDKDKKDKDKKDKEKDNRGNKKKKSVQLKPQQMRRILEAISKEEKKVQEKVNLKKIKGKPIKQDKDW